VHRLAELLQVLRAALAALLKQELGIAPAAPPSVVAGQLFIHPAVGESGKGPLSSRDTIELGREES
jgi:hypothetical protein